MQHKDQDGRAFSARDEFNSLMMYYADVSPIVRSINDGSFVPAIPFDVLERSYKYSEEIDTAYTYWLRGNEDRNAANAIAIAQLWHDTTQLRESLNVGGIPDNPDPSIADLSDANAAIFYNALFLWKSANERANRGLHPVSWGNPLAYKILSAYVAFEIRNLITPEDETSVEGTLASGFNTKQRVYWSLIQSIPAILWSRGYALNRNLVRQTIHAAYGPIVQPLSSINQSIAVPLIDTIFDKDTLLLRPEYFTFTDTHSGLHIGLNHEALYSIPNMAGNTALDFIPHTTTTRCPARYSMGERKSVIRESFEYDVRLAENHWSGFAPAS